MLKVTGCIISGTRLSAVRRPCLKVSDRLQTILFHGYFTIGRYVTHLKKFHRSAAFNVHFAIASVECVPRTISAPNVRHNLSILIFRTAREAHPTLAVFHIRLRTTRSNDSALCEPIPICIPQAFPTSIQGQIGMRTLASGSANSETLLSMAHQHEETERNAP